MNPKLTAGAPFPATEVQALDGSHVDISRPSRGADWKMVVIYRGRHCPICTKYLNALAPYRARLAAIGIDVAAASGDGKGQLEEHLTRLDLSFPVYFGLSVDQMKALGLYISDPRSEKETDHPFAEPGLFVINGDGHLQVVEISNNPFTRPDLEQLVSGLEWIRRPDNNYPIRGMHAYD